MKIETALGLELRNLPETELQTLQEYEGTFGNLTAEEKDSLREWMAHGNSVNNNPHLLYGENGCPVDFINAARIAADMASNPGQYRSSHAWRSDPQWADDDMPF